MGSCRTDVYSAARCSSTVAIVAQSVAVPAKLNHPPVRGGIVPGVALAAAGGVVGLLVHAVVPLVSSVLVAIVLGIALGSTSRRAPRLAPGLAFAARRVLRFGVALLGFQLVVGQVLGLGWGTVLCVVLVVGGGITGTMLIGAALGVPAARRVLIACGFSICGAAAVAAAEGVVDSEEEDVASALGLVVAFGTVAMLALPAAATLLGLGPRDAGAWIGGSVHEVGQVVVAGGIIGGAALQVAVLVKLTRVLMLGPVLVALSLRARGSQVETARTARPSIVPFFVVAFAVLVVISSVLPVPDAVRSGVAHVQEFALATAMFALGCGVDVRALRRLGGADLLLGLLSSLLVAGLALTLVLAA
ncbi:hypothetical protein GCM10027053_17310 [Intrasporangium mesophilum]